MSVAQKPTGKSHTSQGKAFSENNVSRKGRRGGLKIYFSDSPLGNF